MGCTAFDIGILENIIKWHQPKSVIELGAQNNNSSGQLPAPYMRKWYESRFIHYDSIDLNGEDRACKWDLSEELFDSKMESFRADLVTDLGTSEHVSKSGLDYAAAEFSWEAIYNCWLNKHRLLEIGGVMFSENPKTGNWPGHGVTYYTISFYVNLMSLTGYRGIILHEHPAMSNTVDGWNIVSVMKKTSENFPTFEEFQTLDLRKK